MENDWIIGEPPKNKDVCWLLIRGCVVERGESETNVVLAVHDGQTWCEAGCWRGVSCLEPIYDDILAFRDYVIPEPPALEGLNHVKSAW
ncbi:hypothetical protein D3C81_1173090 [compost metagenome]